MMIHYLPIHLQLHSTLASPLWDGLFNLEKELLVWWDRLLIYFAGLASLVWFWVWWSTIHLFICYSKVCVGVSAPKWGLSPSKNLWISKVQVTQLFKQLSYAPACLQLLYPALSKNDCGTHVKMHEYDYPVQWPIHACMLVSCMLTNNSQGKSCHKTSVQSGTGLSKVQKQGRDKRMQEDYSITKQWRKRKPRRLPYTCFPNVCFVSGCFWTNFQIELFST